MNIYLSQRMPPRRPLIDFYTQFYDKMQANESKNEERMKIIQHLCSVRESKIDSLVRHQFDFIVRRKLIFKWFKMYT